MVWGTLSACTRTSGAMTIDCYQAHDVLQQPDELPVSALQHGREYVPQLGQAEPNLPFDNATTRCNPMPKEAVRLSARHTVHNICPAKVSANKSSTKIRPQQLHCTLTVIIVVVVVELENIFVRPILTEFCFIEYISRCRKVAARLVEQVAR